MARQPKQTKAGNNGGDLGFEADLFKAADKLRGNLEPSEYKHVALGHRLINFIHNLAAASLMRAR